MVKIGEIRLQDSGYIKPANTGTQASTEFIAASGTSVSIKSAEFIPSLKRNISIQPELASNVPSEINLGSLENMQFKLRCVLNTTNDDDMALVQDLLDMIRTNGYKFLWYDYTTTGELNNGQLIYRIAQNNNFGTAVTNGEVTSFGFSQNFVVLKVNLNDMQLRHTSKNLITYELTGAIYPVEKSTI